MNVDLLSLGNSSRRGLLYVLTSALVGLKYTSGDEEGNKYCFLSVGNGVLRRPNPSMHLSMEFTTVHRTTWKKIMSPL